MSRKKIELNDFLKRLVEVWNGLVVYISDYENMFTKCLFRCTVCNNVWSAFPINVLRGHGCPECAKIKVANKNKIYLEEMLFRLKEKWGDLISYISDYNGIMTKCWWHCNVCGCDWKARPNNILQGKGCPKCGHKHNAEALMIPLDEFLIRLKEKWGKLIIYVSGYFGIEKKCKFKCAECGHEWEARPHDILKGTGCQKCVKTSMEKPVVKLLDKKGIKYKYNKELKDCVYDKKPLRPDFYIETSKGTLWIETDGQQHFLPIYGEEEFIKIKQRDIYKNEYCKQHGICLIRVTSSIKWGTERHITLDKLLELINKEVDSETGEINFDVFNIYDFNK